MAGDLAYIDRCHREMAATCKGPASSEDEPVCYVGVGGNADLSVARLNAVHAVRDYILAQAKSGVVITALSPIHICTQVVGGREIRRGGIGYIVRAWVRYGRRRK